MQSIIKLGPDDQMPTCSCCVYSKELAGLNELSCGKKGIVSPESKIEKMDFSLD